jgi:hypothetical protein
MPRNLKDLILSGFLSLSKAEQDVLKDVINNGGDGFIKHEEQVRKQEIKIISRKRFNEILERADAFITQRDKEYLQTLMEQRGFSETDTSFKNEVYQGIYGAVGYKFKTDNGIFRFANNVIVRTLPNNQKELNFFINTVEHPSVNAHYSKLANLTYFEVSEKRSQYAYNISSYTGNEKKGHELVMKFIGTAIVDGVKPIYEDEEERVMTKRDLIDKPNTYTLGGNDFLMNG